MGISRDSKHQKCATSGKRNAWRKKHKYELGRQPANTKLSSNKIVSRVHVGGGNAKWSAIVQIGATAEEIQGGNTFMGVEYEHDESSEIKEDQVFDDCSHPEAIANQLASSSPEKKLEPDADKVFDISPQQNEIDVDELQSVKRDEGEEETLRRLESGNPQEEKLENNEYQVLDQILQMYGINMTDIHWDDSVGDEPIELEYSER
ncbi:small ribosomal subunit protein eS8y-like [Lycium barbarum]|uniref:small ribosomal subunit protein eS8y-like n=1 Tax=Lycium barbarum TaxID=112863 RepID=UPI00293F0274|nr:small ribosomal subunit protein eS8y-like [Lycium barbarum]XP_060169994.1 small ribosomal subunit protein eS8y-like [Lycium barbarum]